MTVFPHTSVWLTPGYSVMLGKASPLAIDYELLQQRLQAEDVSASLGEVDLGDGRFMYINRGLGYFLKVRFNVRPEVTIFELRRA